MHYLDHNATSPLRPECLAAVTHALTLGGNPSSIHAVGRAARVLVEDARGAVAQLANAEGHEIIFTSGATEALNLVLAGAIEGAIDQHEKGGAARITRLFVSAIEHRAVLAAAQKLAERAPGVRLEILAVTADGILDTEALRVALREGKGRALVAVMAANNETGVIQPIAEVSRLCREAGALLLVDAVPAAGKIDLDAQLCDYLVLSAHKMGGPSGSGALIVRSSSGSGGAPLAAQIMGGMQQNGLRAGTENLSGIAGLGAAARTLRDGEGERARIAHLRDRFESMLKQVVPEAVIFGAASPRLCGTCCFALPGVTAQTAQIALDLDGVMVSAGSSCASGKVLASHVLAAMQVDYAQASCAVRVSFGWNSESIDVDAAIASLTKLWQRKAASAERAA
jgi:cysteine desulfurase